MTASRRRGGARRAVAAASGVLVAALAGCAAGPGPDAGPSGAAGEIGAVTVLAAASLTEVFDTLALAFEGAHPRVDVVVGYGGSGGLAEQVRAGVPADVFAAAAEEPMAALVADGLATRPVVFATNSLALVVPAGNPGRVTGLADLSRDGLAVALCDVGAPCGAAASELLDRAGVAARPDTLEQDVKAVLTRVRLGEADAGLVYATDVAAAGAEVETVPLVGATEVVNRYPIAVLAEAPNPVAAAAFVAFVRGPQGRAALAAAGFGGVDGDGADGDADGDDAGGTP